MPRFGKWNPKMSRALGRALGENNDPRRPSGVKLEYNMDWSRITD